MKSRVDRLREHPFFQDFPEKYLEKIAEWTTFATFNPGQYIFRLGEDADMFYLIEKGVISLEVYVPKCGPVTIETLGTGDVLGWSWLYAPHRWQFDARAVEVTNALVINAKILRSQIEDDHELGYQMMTRISRIVRNRLQATRMKLMEVYNIYQEPDEEDASRPDWQKLI
ncbi:MAG: cyclic nucleotide-binding domain-containing protein [Calditrichaeota bacterium]|nr:MAG: cyclic nucleotide-binding domain-containing protein [Calditrichota bacterium]